VRVVFLAPCFCTCIIMMNGGNKVCKYWLQGSCRFGRDCKFLHPKDNQLSANTIQQPGGFASSKNTFATLAQQNNSHKHAASTQPTKEQIRTSIIQDLQTLPIWPFTCYSYDKNTPLLITGDVSPEELRYIAYDQVKKTGNLNQYHATVAQLKADADNKRKQLMSKPDLFLGQTMQQPSSIFVQPNPSQNQNFTFGNFGAQSPVPTPSTLGQHQNQTQNLSFGSFGSPQQPNSNPSQNPVPVFGSASFGGTAFGNAAQSFTQNIATPSQNSGGSAFGKPSFPQPSVFGNTIHPGTSVLGNASIFGDQTQPVPTPPMFGNTSNVNNFNTNNSAFAAPLQNNSNFAQQTPIPQQSIFGDPKPISSPINNTPYNSATPPKPTFAQNNLGSNVSQNDSVSALRGGGNDMYTQIWKAPEFRFGEIPEIEPPEVFR
jgi:hypothetical protein